MEDATLALFDKKGGAGRNVGSTDEDLSAQQLQKKQAFQRNQALLNAPAHVKSKWGAICSLRGRDRSKNAAKTKFTEMMLKDTKFEHAYWEDNVIDSYSRAHDKTGIWKLRTRVDAEHGGGTAGKESVQQAIDCGMYHSRKIKAKGPDGKAIELEEVCVTTEGWSDTHLAELRRKVRAGGKSSEQEYKKAILDTFDPTADDTMLAIEDKLKKKPSASTTSTPLKLIMKRPAGKPSASVKDEKPDSVIIKKPAGSSSAAAEPAMLTAGALATHDEELEKKNTSINQCVANSLRILQQKTTLLMDALHILQHSGFSGTEADLAEVHLKLMRANDAKLKTIHAKMQAMYVEKRASDAMGDKIAALNEAGSICADVDSCIKAAKHLTKGGSNGRKANSKAGSTLS